jgi:xylose isomerase
MDTFARGLVIADDIRNNSNFLQMKKDRYASYDSGDGASYEAGKLTLEKLRDLAAQNGEPKRISGKIELYESIVNHFIK